jgi:hypothetical protein
MGVRLESIAEQLGRLTLRYSDKSLRSPNHTPRCNPRSTFTQGSISCRLSPADTHFVHSHKAQTFVQSPSIFTASFHIDGQVCLAGNCLVMPHDGCTKPLSSPLLACPQFKDVVIVLLTLQSHSFASACLGWYLQQHALDEALAR